MGFCTAKGIGFSRSSTSSWRLACCYVEYDYFSTWDVLDAAKPRPRSPDVVH